MKQFRLNRIIRINIKKQVYTFRDMSFKYNLSVTFPVLRMRSNMKMTELYDSK